MVYRVRPGALVGELCEAPNDGDSLMTSKAPAFDQDATPAARRQLDPHDAASHLPRLRRLARAV